jgi:protein dithiol oxidoreductase (disulfide-forming)
MNRRDFSLQLAATGAVLATATAAQAQGGPVEGTHYVKLNTPAPVSLAADKKIEVVEFFWYECPACNAFEPALESWVKRLPADVQFRYIPVGFTARHQVTQRLFYTLEAMGQLVPLHRRIFAAIHVQNRRLGTESEMMNWVKEQGVDMARFNELYKSFQVNTAGNRARQLSDAYRIDGVPALGVHGRFWTSGALAGGGERARATTNFLIERVRSGKI